MMHIHPFHVWFLSLFLPFFRCYGFSSLFCTHFTAISVMFINVHFAILPWLYEPWKHHAYTNSFSDTVLPPLLLLLLLQFEYRICTRTHIWFMCSNKIFSIFAAISLRSNCWIWRIAFTQRVRTVLSGEWVWWRLLHTKHAKSTSMCACSMDFPSILHLMPSYIKTQ